MWRDLSSGGTRWSHTVNGSSHTVEGTSLLAVDMPDDGLAQGHTVVGESNASQHSIQLVMCGGQICLRGGRGWGGEGGGVHGYRYYETSKY